jgi:hypothetical protein
MSQQDFWGECFDPAAGMSPNQFTGTFCNRCMNGDCERSAAEGTSWFKRVSTQEDRLLLQPKFADPRDPKYRDVANLDFRSALKEAITLEIADRRGDWSIPTDAEVAIEASRVAAGQGMSPPPEPPEPPTPPAASDGIVLRVTVRGQTADYEVTLNDDGAWACSCPAFRFARANPCRHIQQAEADLEQGRQEPTPPPPVPVQPVLPPAPAGFRPPSAPAVTGASPPGAPRPPMRNIPMPSGGIMADGTAPPPPRPAAPAPAASPPPAADPWALPPDKAPPAKGTIVPVGGKVVMGKKP